MSIVASSLDAYALPEQTRYAVDKPKRTAYQRTHSSGQYDDKGSIITEDFTIEVTIVDTTRTVYDALMTRYDSATEYTFTGHLDAADTWKVKIQNVEVNTEVGLYQITMTLKVTGTP